MCLNLGNFTLIGISESRCVILESHTHTHNKHTHTGEREIERCLSSCVLYHVLQIGFIQTSPVREVSQRCCKVESSQIDAVTSTESMILRVLE